MFAARRVIVKTMPQVRQYVATSGPPSNYISIPERVVHGVIMGAACLSIPAYILTHIRHYRGLE